MDSVGDLYIADYLNARVRKVTNGVITTFAGGGAASEDNIPATSAQLSGLGGVAVDSSGNVYIASDYRIRKVSGGVITTVAGNATAGFSGDNGPATSAQLNLTLGITVDSGGNLWIADSNNGRIRKVSGGVINTVAGNGTCCNPPLGDNGPATSAQLEDPSGVAVDSAGNLYIACNPTRKVSGGVITTVAGASTGVAVDLAGNLYIADLGGISISKLAGGVIAVVAGRAPAPGIGDNGPATSAALSSNAFGLAVDSAGNVYIGDAGNNRTRKVSNGVITTVAGNGTQGFSGDNGPAIAAELSVPNAVAADSAGNLFVSDYGNNRIRDVSNGVITTLAGDGIETGVLGDNGPATSASLAHPTGVAVDASGNVFIADTAYDRIRKVSRGVITTVAGNGTPGFGGDNGPATSAQLNIPLQGGVAVDSAGNLYIADYGNDRIREVSNGVINTVAGNGTCCNPAALGVGDNGPATSATLIAASVALDSTGNLYIADSGNGRIRRVSNGIITTIAGGGSSFVLNGAATSSQIAPLGVAVDSAGNVYFVESNAYGDEPSIVRLLTPNAAPAIAQGGIVPVYSPVPIIQPGSWVSIYGTGLANGSYLWNGDFPTLLGGTSVTIDNKPAYLWVVTPNQINLQVPNDAAAGVVSVAVTTAFGTRTSTVTLAPQGPTFCLLGDGRHAAGEIATPNGTGAYGGGIYDRWARPIRSRTVHAR